MTITHEITLDLVSQERPPRIQAKQGEAFTRQVAITLLANGEPWVPPHGTPAVIRYHAHDADKGADTSGIYDTLPDGRTAWTVSENVITLTLIPQMLAAYGIVRVDVAFYAGDAVLATANFDIYVNQAPADGTRAEAGDYYRVSTLDALNAWIEEKEQQLEALAQTVRAAGKEVLLLEGDLTADSGWSVMSFPDPVGYSRITAKLDIVGTAANTGTWPLLMMINDDGPVAQIGGAVTDSPDTTMQVDIAVLANGHTLISRTDADGGNVVEFQRHSVDFSAGLENIWFYAPGSAALLGAGTWLEVTGIRA